MHPFPALGRKCARSALALTVAEFVGLRCNQEDGDTLRISTPPQLIKGKVQTAHLVWKRARRG